MSVFRFLFVFLAWLPALQLAGCVTAPPAELAPQAPAAWHSPSTSQDLPHGGSVQQLLDWWAGWHDPLLSELIASAQQLSPDLATAAARIAQARAGAVGTQAAMLPQIDAQAGIQRAPATSMNLPNVPPDTEVNAGQAGVQLQWELDLFGGLRHANRAAQARLQGAQAQWHQGRVSVAADTANQYLALRACQSQWALSSRDATSRSDTARLTAELTRAGFAAPAALAVTRGGAAQSRAQTQQIEAQCQSAIQGLVALTGWDEARLRQRLQTQAAGDPPALAVDRIPARVLAQRPDLYAAAQAVAAASGDVGQADAQRYPHLGLSGNIVRSAIRIPSLDVRSSDTTWSLGPLSITVPLFDGGRRRAQLQASKAQYEASVLQYRASVRNAVREVETALNDWHSTQQRREQTDTAAQQYHQAFIAAQAKYRAGMGSLLDLEDARRNDLQAQNAQVALRQQRGNAAVALYRALGGGWEPTRNATSADIDLVQAGEQTRSAPPASP